MQTIKAGVKALLPKQYRRRVREQLIGLRVKHVSGVKRLQLADNEAIVTCVVKNGEYYIEEFIRHYLGKGFRHIFFLDNGSSDRTCSIAQRFEQVSVYRCDLSPIESYQAAFKTHLATQSAIGGWCIDADIDEFFDYPCSQCISLTKFLQYLNTNRYTAVMTQLLDMFSNYSLAELKTKGSESLAALYKYYDISDVSKVSYHDPELTKENGNHNAVTNADTALYFGGIRRTICGYNCLLTKHSLFRTNHGLDLFPHVHFVNRARLADLSAVMYHYKFTSNALSVASQSIEGFPGLSPLYKGLMEFATNKETHRLKQSTAQKLAGLNELVDNGFLLVSREYERYARATSTPPRPEEMGDHYDSRYDVSIHRASDTGREERRSGAVETIRKYKERGALLDLGSRVPF